MQQCSASPQEMHSSLPSDRRTPDTSFDSPQNSPTQNQLSDGGRRRDNSGGKTNSHGERLVSSPGSSWRVSYTGEQRTRSATMVSSPDGSPAARQLKPLHHSRMKAKSMVQVVVPKTSVPPQGRCNAKPRRGVGNSGGSSSTTRAMRYGSFSPASAAGCVSPPLHASPSHHRPGGYVHATPPATTLDHSGIVSLVRNPSGSLSPRSSPTPAESEGTPHPTPATAAAASSWNLRSPQDPCMPPPLYAMLAHSHHRDPTSDDVATPCTPTDQIAYGGGGPLGFHEHFGDTISSAGTSFCTPTLTGRSPHPRGSTSMPHPMPSSWLSPGGSTQLFNASFGARRRSSEHSSGSFWSPHPLCFPSPMRRPDSSYSIFTDDLEASTCGQPPAIPLELDDDATSRVRIMWAEGAWGGTTHSSSGSLAPQSSSGPPPSTTAMQPTKPSVERQRAANPLHPGDGAYPWSFSSSVFHETSACDTALATAAGSQVAAAPAPAQPGFDIEAVDVHSDAGSSHSSTNAHHAPAQCDDAVGVSVSLAEDDGCHIQTTPLHRQDDWICAGTLHAIDTRRFAKHSPR